MMALHFFSNFNQPIFPPVALEKCFRMKTHRYALAMTKDENRTKNCHRESSSFLTVIKCFIYFLSSLVVMDESLVLFSLCYKVFYLLPKQPGGDGRESSSFLTVL